ncbi:unnamed protein product, partial [Protopolystoma xenopodis]
QTQIFSPTGHVGVGGGGAISEEDAGISSSSPASSAGVLATPKSFPTEAKGCGAVEPALNNWPNAHYSAGLPKSGRNCAFRAATARLLPSLLPDRQIREIAAKVRRKRGNRMMLIVIIGSICSLGLAPLSSCLLGSYRGLVQTSLSSGSPPLPSLPLCLGAANQPLLSSPRPRPAIFGPPGQIRSSGDHPPPRVNASSTDFASNHSSLSELIVMSAICFLERNANRPNFVYSTRSVDLSGICFSLYTSIQVHFT